MGYYGRSIEFSWHVSDLDTWLPVVSYFYDDGDEYEWKTLNYFNVFLNKIDNNW